MERSVYIFLFLLPSIVVKENHFAKMVRFVGSFTRGTVFQVLLITLESSLLWTNEFSCSNVEN